MKKVIRYILWVSFLLATLTFWAYSLSAQSSPEPASSANFLPGGDEIDAEPPVPPTPDIGGETQKPEPSPAPETTTKNEPKNIPEAGVTPNGKYSSTGTYYKQWTVQEVQENEEEFVEWGRQSTYSGFSTYTDYAQTILGKCPSQREDNSWEDGNPLPALGIIPDYGTLEQDIENVWALYKMGQSDGRDRMARRFGLTYVNSTLTIEYNGNDHYYAQKAVELTNYLRSLDSRYKAKCPNN